MKRQLRRRQLKIGTLLPQTGSLAFLGPPEFAGVDLAIKDINDAGGVIGKQSRSTPTRATPPPTSPRSRPTACSSHGVDAVIGAASSGVSLTVIDKITGSGVLQISPANTSTS